MSVLGIACTLIITGCGGTGSDNQAVPADQAALQPESSEPRAIYTFDPGPPEGSTIVDATPPQISEDSTDSSESPPESAGPPSVPDGTPEHQKPLPQISGGNPSTPQAGGTEPEPPLESATGGQQAQTDDVHNSPTSVDTSQPFDYDPAGARYVSHFGNDSNDGLTKATAWKSIGAAAQRAEAGQTIFVQAGLYLNERIKFNQDGTEARPIRIVGFSVNPGDAPSLRHGEYPRAMNASLLPLLDGGNRAQGTAVNLNGRRYIEIRNLQIRNYEIAFYGSSTRNTLVDNVFAADLGDVNAHYSGLGYKMAAGSTNNKISNSIVANSAAEGIMLVGDWNEIVGCLVYANDNSTGVHSNMDYYMLSMGSNNRIASNVIHRIGELVHGGHGMGVSAYDYGPSVSTQNNIVEDNLALNFTGSAFYVRFRGATNNTFRRNTARGGRGGGFVARDGAFNNVIEKHTVVDMGRGLMIMDTIDDEWQETGANNNRFSDFTITNARYAAIEFSDYLFAQSTSNGNIFERFVVDGGPYLFSVKHRSLSNTLKDSEIRNVTNLAEYGSTNLQNAGTGFTFERNLFLNNGFPAP